MGPASSPATEASTSETEQRLPRTCRRELRCDAIGRNGPCRAPRRPGSTRCYWHDEQLREYRQVASSRGGRTPRRNAVRARLAYFDWSKDCPECGWEKYQALARRGLALGQLSVSAYDRLIEDGYRNYQWCVREAEENASLRAAEADGEANADGLNVATDRS